PYGGGVAGQGCGTTPFVGACHGKHPSGTRPAGRACAAPTAFSVFQSLRPATAALQRPRDERW
ncbi:MAG: hypothetical protein OXC05_16635, partial [Halieaceae bacterium]|nr:hypothetical protein [Halieaceae bacterium]